MADKIPLIPYGPTAGRRHMAGKPPRPKTLTVDFHGHMFVPAADELVKPHLSEESHLGRRQSNPRTREISQNQFRERFKEWSGIEERLADMDKMDLDVMAVSCAPPQFHYGVDAGLGHESSQLINDTIADQIAPRPDRFVGIATVPLQDTGLALTELERAVNDLGFRGVMVQASVGDEELSAERLEPFWARCEALEIPVFIHPASFKTTRFGRNYLTNIIGNPLDTTVAVHYLIFDGVMARYPRLKVFLAHGGAFAGAYGARMDHGFGARPDCRDHIDELPSTYLKRFYYDTVVFSVGQLAYLIDTFGAEHVVLGTDYPADMGEYNPVEHVYQVEGLEESAREKICGLNALDLMGIDESRFRS
ncbi:MAG: amidohydrolase family protein [Rhizobiales bacterium]|nr:amidohydrolase family protein [Hyphomicrobiales bacterium]